MNPVRNSSEASNPAGIILGPNPAAKQRGIISNGVNGLKNAGRQWTFIPVRKGEGPIPFCITISIESLLS
jgi:hypothetical protein